jgi:RecB family exonuclease
LVKNHQTPQLTDLLKLFEQHWSPLGYLSLAHQQRMKQRGIRLLTDYYHHGYLPGQQPLVLEQPFALRLDKDFKIGGKIDRVDRLEKGVEIIDYKTGQVLNQKEVDNSLQMTIYALAAVSEDVLNQKAAVVRLTFYYLETGETRSTFRTDQQLHQAKNDLINKAQEINQSNFSPTPGRMCEFCDFRLLCEAWN